MSAAHSGTGWSERELARLRGLASTGLTAEDIAKHFPHRTFEAVRVKLKELGGLWRLRSIWGKR